MLENIMNFINEDNYDRSIMWTEHRNKICKLISCSLKSEYDISEDDADTDINNERKIIVFGAGRCEDLDFNYLYDNFSEIHLVDIDEKTLISSIEKLPSSIKNKIKVLEGFDFSGLDKFNYYEKLEELIEEGKLKKIIKYIRKTAQQINAYDNIGRIKHKYNIAMSTAVYTQLCYIPSLFIIMPKVSDFTKSEINIIKKELVYLTNIVVKKYNDLLISSVIDGGSVIAISDILELSNNMSNNMPYRNEVISKNQSIRNLAVERLLKEGYGLVGGEEGIKDISSKLIEQTVESEEWIWNFSSNRKFLTRGIIGKI
ncbi:hypothetical protein CLTEP_07000 [Clostridium tepidiprofundi DSM 19306]|uniref:Uncharacterized protein n=1 Tax=Clostridium tepidiprofundi DSM 19306 TaxID=1121338 RepID=A0A151B5Y1_9CLOT|nr:hypothetical protein [Clostridium tepidiprofundi]KYH35296.1 hypothetical protein CLTEP_07000 [Clostridium tepidiprofundi DSM 19306]